MKCKRLMLAAIVASTLLNASQSFAIPVDLGTAGNFAILAMSGVSTTGTTTVVGDIGVSPIGATGVTGFGLVLDASNTFSTSSLVIGKVFAATYAPPTPANLTTAVGDMQTAYTNAAGRPADFTGLGAGNIGGLTLAPGVYKWGTGVTIPTDVTLSGGSSDVWIFQIAGTLVVSSDTQIILSGGALAGNVFWQVAGQTTLGTMSRFKGTILDQTAIVMNTGATLDGRALAQTAVTLQSNTVTQADSMVVNAFYFIESSNDPDNNICKVGVSDMEYKAFGQVTGVGTSAQTVRISYDAPNPTDASSSKKGISVKQAKFSTLDVLFDDTSATGGPVIVKQCWINGRSKSKKPTGEVSVKCILDPVLALLTPGQIASVETAFAGNPAIRFKVDGNGTKGSLWIRCRGAASTN